jgi:tetrapyrrole methylase family protein/MazG family protein
LADQAQEFEWNDVVRLLSAKLVRRHQHVFGSVEVSGASDVVRNWDRLKAEERAGHPPAESAVDGIPKSLPALKYASEQARKASKAGFDWPTREGTLDKVREELAELLAASSVAERREELGDLLWIIAKLAMQDDIDPEEALRAANRKFGARFRTLEQIAAERGWPNLTDRPIADLLSAWTEAKQRAASR